MANINVSELMKLLSTMDKKDLEKSLSQASKFINTEDANNILNELKKSQENNK